jgi:hypothetical protein
MSMETDYRLALGVPAGLVAGSILPYYLLVAVGIDRELALDSVTVTVAIAAVAILRGVHQAPLRTWSLELGGLLATLIAAGTLALRAISLASSAGPLFYFAVVSSAALAYAAHRILRRMARSATKGADPQPTPPPDGPLRR